MSNVKLSSIPADNYFEYALSLTLKENGLVKDFGKWLPGKIIDAHVHSNTQCQCNFIDSDFFSHIASTFPWFEIAKHTRVNHILYPKREVKMLAFPIPFRGINHRAANDYILDQAAKSPSIIPVLYGIPDDIEYTISKIKTRKFYGLKMYHAYFSPRAQKIYDYFPAQILKCCEELGIPIILHLPRPVIECEGELITILREFPDLKIVLAHSGLAILYLKGLRKTLRLLSKYKNIYLDTAGVTSVEVLKAALDAFGYYRVIFGTDQPFNLIRGRFYHNPFLGIRFATKYPYHWISIEEQRKFSRHVIGDIVLLHWQILLALQRAIKLCGGDKDIKNCIFSKNAERVFRLH